MGVDNTAAWFLAFARRNCPIELVEVDFEVADLQAHLIGSAS